jgi:hypothetical protein
VKCLVRGPHLFLTQRYGLFKMDKIHIISSSHSKLALGFFVARFYRSYVI